VPACQLSTTAHGREEEDEKRAHMHTDAVIAVGCSGSRGVISSS
jgi:hypothetical protein